MKILKKDHIDLLVGMKSDIEEMVNKYQDFIHDEIDLKQYDYHTSLTLSDSEQEIIDALNDIEADLSMLDADLHRVLDDKIKTTNKRYKEAVKNNTK